MQGRQEDMISRVYLINGVLYDQYMPAHPLFSYSGGDPSHDALAYPLTHVRFRWQDAGKSHLSPPPPILLTSAGEGWKRMCIEVIALYRTAPITWRRVCQTPGGLPPSSFPTPLSPDAPWDFPLARLL